MTAIQDHPLRYALANELHARPFPELSAPCHAVFLAIKQPVEAAARDRDGLDAYVARLSWAGEPRWVTTLGSGGEDGLDGAAVAPDGSIYVSGQYSVFARGQERGAVGVHFGPGHLAQDRGGQDAVYEDVFLQHQRSQLRGRTWQTRYPFSLPTVCCARVKPQLSLRSLTSASLYPATRPYP